VPNTLLEIWQANPRRYIHVRDQHPAPLVRTSPAPAAAQSIHRLYKFTTVKPGAYPGAITTMPGGRRISTSFGFGQAFISRLVTQMYSRTIRVSVRSDLSTRDRREGARAHGLLVRPWKNQSRNGRCAKPLRHRAGAGANATPMRNIVQDAIDDARTTASRPTETVVLKSA